METRHRRRYEHIHGYDVVTDMDMDTNQRRHSRKMGSDSLRWGGRQGTFGDSSGATAGTSAEKPPSARTPAPVHPHTLADCECWVPRLFGRRTPRCDGRPMSPSDPPSLVLALDVAAYRQLGYRRIKAHWVFGSRCVGIVHRPHTYTARHSSRCPRGRRRRRTNKHDACLAPLLPTGMAAAFARRAAAIPTSLCRTRAGVAGSKCHRCALFSVCKPDPKGCSAQPDRLWHGAARAPADHVADLPRHTHTHCR